jgi:hypothetical protein
MGTTFVLVVMFAMGNAGGATSAEFGTKAACEAASAEIRATFRGGHFNRAEVFCMRKY